MWVSYSYLGDTILMFAYCKWTKHYFWVFCRPLIFSCPLFPIFNLLSGLVNSAPETSIDVNFAPSFLLNPPKQNIIFCLSVQFSSVAQLCLTLCHPMDCSRPGFPVHHWLLEHTQTHVHRVSDAIQPSHPLSSPFPPAFNLSQHQGLFQWVGSLHQVAKVLELQLQHQSFQWLFRTDFL